MVGNNQLSSRFIKELDSLSSEETARLYAVLTELINLQRALRRFSCQLDIDSAREVRYFAANFEVENWPLEFCEAVVEHINFHAAPTALGEPYAMV